MSRRIRRSTTLLALLPLLLAGCAARGAPPGPGFERGGIPDLRGARLLVLPLQLTSDVHDDAAREIEYALGAGAGGSSWILPAELRETLAANPGTRAGIDALPVDVFLRREVERVGDPLFGELYRLGVLTNATYALLPVEARARVTGEGLATAEIAAALIDVRSGRVYWFGIVGGSPAEPGSLASVAAAAEALARRVGASLR